MICFNLILINAYYKIRSIIASQKFFFHSRSPLPGGWNNSKTIFNLKQQKPFFLKMSDIVSKLGLLYFPMLGLWGLIKTDFDTIMSSSICSEANKNESKLIQIFSKNQIYIASIAIHHSWYLIFLHMNFRISLWQVEIDKQNNFSTDFHFVAEVNSIKYKFYLPEITP